MTDRARIRVLAGFAASALVALVVSPARAAPKTYTVVIDKMAFMPVALNVKVGDTVVWVNHDIFQHTATAKDGRFDLDMPPGASGKAVLKKAGTLDYMCSYHPGMNGRLVVAP